MGTGEGPGGLTFHVLGPTRVTGPGGGALDLGPRRQRELLTLLLLRPNTPVAIGRLADELWHGEPPRGARATIHAYVAALRRVLEPGRRAPFRVLVTRDDTYTLDTRGHAVDADLPAAELARARALPYEQARDVLAACRSRWASAEPFAELAGHVAADAARARLAEQLLVLDDELTECRLRLGEHAEVVADLRERVAAHPLRERPYAQLARALDACGRPAEALETLERARRVLADELGLEPGPQLRAAQARVLRRDTAHGRPGDPRAGGPRAGGPRAADPCAGNPRSDGPRPPGGPRSPDPRSAGDPRAADGPRSPGLRHTGPRPAEPGSGHGSRPGPGPGTAPASGPDPDPGPVPAPVPVPVPGPEPGPPATPVPAATPGREPGPGHAPGPGPGRGPRERPFVGRDHELRRLTDAWDMTCRSGRPAVAVVSGEAGIGKSRLVARFTAIAAGGGAKVHRGGCAHASGAPPYWPWLQMPELFADPGDGRTDHNGRNSGTGDNGPNPEGSGTGADGPNREGSGTGGNGPDREGGGTGGPDRFRRAVAVVAALRARAAGRPQLVVVEDLQWADPASLAVLDVVAEELRDAPVMLVVTVRDGAGGGPPERTLAALARHPDRVALPLRGLTVDQVSSLVKDLDVPVPDARELHDRTGGNPFFVVELARAAGPVADTAGSALDAVRPRLRALAPRVLEVLRYAAAVGRTWGPRVVATAAGLAYEDVLAAVDTAVAAGVLEATPPGRGAGADDLWFRHDLIREALVADMGRAEQARIAGRIAAALETELGAGVPPAVLAHHLRIAAAGRADARAARVHLAAALAALGGFAYEDAADLARRGAALVPGTGTGLRVALLTVCGQALRLAGDQPAADPVLREAAALARACGDPVGAARAVLERAGGGVGGFHTLFLTGTPDVLDDIEAALDELPPGQGELRNRLLVAAAVRAAHGEPARAAEALARAVPGPGRDAADLLVARILTRWTGEHAAERLAMTGRLLGLPSLPPEVDLIGRHLRRATFLELGDVAAAERVSADFERRLRRRRDPDFAVLQRCWEAGRHLYAGRYDDAAAVAAELEAVHAGTSGLALTAAAQSAGTIHGITAWDRGTLGTLLPLMDDMESFTPEWALIRALAHAEDGDGAAAAAVVARLTGPDLAEVPDGPYATVYVVLLAVVCARVPEAFPDEVAARALHARLAAAGDGQVSFLPGLVFLGPVALYRGALALTLGRVGAAVRDLSAAVALADATGGVPYAVRARRALARVLRARGGPGDDAAAAAADARARDDAGRIGMRLP